MDTNTIASQINNLNEMLKLMDSTVKFNFQIMWAVLAFVVVAAGGSLSLLAKQWFDSAMNKRERSLNEKIALLESDIRNTKKSRITGTWTDSATFTNIYRRTIQIGFRPSYVRILIRPNFHSVNYVEIIINGQLSESISLSNQGMRFGRRGDQLVDSFEGVSYFGKTISLSKAEIVENGFSLEFVCSEINKEVTLNPMIAYYELER